MTDTISKHERNLSAIIHGSTLCRFFIPFGQFILPLVLWLSNKERFAFVDYNGKQALNFQISMFLYSFILGAVSIPFFLASLPGLFDGGILHWSDFHNFESFRIDLGDDGFGLPFAWWPLGIGTLLGFGLFVVNIVYTILATIRTNEGEYFRYPFTIKFIK